MRRPTPLPDPFRDRPFASRAAIAAGVGEKRLRGADLARPFHGARLDASDELTVWARISAYSERMPPSQHFSHTTAAVIHRMPLPLSHESAPRLHVRASASAGFPRARGIVGHHADDTAAVVRRAGYRVTAPVDTWCDLGALLELDDLVAIGDFLITGDEPYSGKPPLASHAQLEHALRARAGRRGIRRLSHALTLVRYGPLSPMETFARLLVMRAGLPEPRINHVILDGVVWVAMVDLAFPEWNVAVEYQGDGHREKKRFRDDITRRERIEDHGWTVVYLSADDIQKYPEATVARIRARLRARGAPV